MRHIVASLAFIISAANVAHASELRCSGSIIKENMTMSQVESLCVSPVAKDSQEVVYREVTKDNHEKDTYETRESWLFDTDSGSDLRAVTFVMNRVKSVQVLNQRGLDANARTAKCEKSPTNIHKGMNSLLVAYFCGNSPSKSVVSDEFKPDNRHFKTDVTTTRRLRTERWDYQAGGKELRITLRDGVVNAVE
jgi:hypothetical protein